MEIGTEDAPLVGEERTEQTQGRAAEWFFRRRDSPRRA